MAQTRPPLLVPMSSPLALCTIKTVLSTGVPPLDAILGGGVPVGRITEIYGDQSTGKTMLGNQLIAACQRADGLAVLGDSETAANTTVMGNVGIHVPSLMYSAPDDAEEVFGTINSLMDSRFSGKLEGAVKEAAKRLVEESDDRKAAEKVIDGWKTKIFGGTCMLYVWDSVAATTAGREREKESGQHYSIQARIISEEFRKHARDYARANLAVVALNQRKDSIGVMFGEQDSTFGGKALPFHATVRIKLSLRAKVKEDKRVVGYDVKALVTKSKVAPPFRSCRLPVTFGHGVLVPTSVLWYLMDAKALKQAGAYYTLEMPGYEPVRFLSRDWNGIYQDSFEAIDAHVAALAARDDIWRPDRKPVEVESVLEDDEGDEADVEGT